LIKRAVATVTMHGLLLYRFVSLLETIPMPNVVLQFVLFCEI
jgi:hypothetical protein